MDPKVTEALRKVSLTIDAFNAAVETWMGDLKKAGEDEAQIQKLTGSAHAMRDSGNIYLAWAQHLAEGLPQEEEVGPVSGE